jgi:hypothetical protein
MRLAITFAIGSIVCLPAILFAQDPSSSNSYQFQFTNPGARSLALGGAFTGLSDDATAVFANPAGLTFLSKIEMSMELRSARTEAEYFSGGREGGVPTGRGIDTVTGPIYATAVSNTTRPSFLSVVIPRQRFVLAFARNETLRVKRTADRQGLILRFSTLNEDFRDNIERNTLDVTIASYGATFAAKLSRCLDVRCLSIGGGISVAHFEGSQRQSIFNKPQPSFGPSDIVNFSPADLDGIPYLEIVTDSDTPIALEGRIGILWRASAKVQVGASYRRGPQFSLVRNAATFREPQRHIFKVPDVLTAGVAIRPRPALSLTSDVSFIDYRDLSKSSATFDIYEAKFPRTVEIRAGAEYLFSTRFRPAVRVGLWREPYSGPVAAGTLYLGLDREQFPPRPATTHASFGGGVTLRPSFDLNFAADLSTTSRTVSVSAIAYLGR